jgi:hypothetical protein
MVRHSVALEASFDPDSSIARSLIPAIPKIIRQPIWRRWLAALIANQERRARWVTAPYLARESDAMLKDIGFNSDQIAAIRRAAGDRQPIGL